jgi:hypothetical protein
MDDLVPFGSRVYFLTFAVMAFARGMDILSTRIATPNMVLEGNPLAKKLGWKWGIAVSMVMSAGFGLWPLPAVVISTTSVLVAARNFQYAWLMRTLGEEEYRAWHVARLQETRTSLYLFCLFGQTALTAAIGAALIYFCPLSSGLVPAAIGLGVICYAAAVAFFTLLSVWRMRRAFA